MNDENSAALRHITPSRVRGGALTDNKQNNDALQAVNEQKRTQRR